MWPQGHHAGATAPAAPSSVPSTTPTQHLQNYDNTTTSATSFHVSSPYAQVPLLHQHQQSREAMNAPSRPILHQDANALTRGLPTFTASTQAALHTEGNAHTSSHSPNAATLHSQTRVNVPPHHSFSLVSPTGSMGAGPYVVLSPVNNSNPVNQSFSAHHFSYTTLDSSKGSGDGRPPAMTADAGGDNRNMHPNTTVVPQYPVYSVVSQENTNLSPSLGVPYSSTAASWGMAAPPTLTTPHVPGSHPTGTSSGTIATAVRQPCTNAQVPLGAVVYPDGASSTGVGGGAGFTHGPQYISVLPPSHSPSLRFAPYPGGQPLHSPATSAVTVLRNDSHDNNPYSGSNSNVPSSSSTIQRLDGAHGATAFITGGQVISGARGPADSDSIGRRTSGGLGEAAGTFTHVRVMPVSASSPTLGTLSQAQQPLHPPTHLPVMVSLSSTSSHPSLASAANVGSPTAMVEPRLSGALSFSSLAASPQQSARSVQGYLSSSTLMTSQPLAHPQQQQQQQRQLPHSLSFSLSARTSAGLPALVPSDLGVVAHSSPSISNEVTPLSSQAPAHAQQQQQKQGQNEEDPSAVREAQGDPLARFATARSPTPGTKEEHNTSLHHPHDNAEASSSAATDPAQGPDLLYYVHKAADTTEEGANRGNATDAFGGHESTSQQQQQQQLMRRRWANKGKAVLFVGQLPTGISESEVKTIFSFYGPVLKVHILRDSSKKPPQSHSSPTAAGGHATATGAKSSASPAKIVGGSAFVFYPSPLHADVAIAALHGRYLLKPASRRAMHGDADRPCPTGTQDSEGGQPLLAHASTAAGSDGVITTTAHKPLLRSKDCSRCLQVGYAAESGFVSFFGAWQNLRLHRENKANNPTVSQPPCPPRAIVAALLAERRLSTGPVVSPYAGSGGGAVGTCEGSSPVPRNASFSPSTSSNSALLSQPPQHLMQQQQQQQAYHQPELSCKDVFPEFATGVPPLVSPSTPEGGRGNTRGGTFPYVLSPLPLHGQSQSQQQQQQQSSPTRQRAASLFSPSSSTSIQSTGSPQAMMESSVIVTTAAAASAHMNASEDVSTTLSQEALRRYRRQYDAKRHELAVARELVRRGIVVAGRTAHGKDDEPFTQKFISFHLQTSDTAEDKNSKTLALRRDEALLPPHRSLALFRVERDRVFFSALTSRCLERVPMAPSRTSASLVTNSLSRGEGITAVSCGATTGKGTRDSGSELLRELRILLSVQHGARKQLRHMLAKKARTQDIGSSTDAHLSTNKRTAATVEQCLLAIASGLPTDPLLASVREKLLHGQRQRRVVLVDPLPSPQGVPMTPDAPHFSSREPDRSQHPSVPTLQHAGRTTMSALAPHTTTTAAAAATRSGSNPHEDTDSIVFDTQLVRTSSSMSDALT